MRSSIPGAFREGFCADSETAHATASEAVATQIRCMTGSILTVSGGPVADFTSHPSGTFSWPELSTTDQKGAVAFYRALFGWGLNDQPMGPGETYSMFTLR